MIDGRKEEAAKNKLCTIQHFIRALISWKINHWKKCNLESRKKEIKIVPLNMGNEQFSPLTKRNLQYDECFIKTITYAA